MFKRIIPCLDTILDGNGKAKVVKGVRFGDLRYAGDPVELAAKYDQQGADEIVFLDITATPENRKTIIQVVEKVAKQVSVPLCVGGGIRSLEDFKAAFNAGAAKVSVNTAVVKRPKLIAEVVEAFGSQRTVVAIDCKRRFSDLEGRNVIEVESDREAWYEVMVSGGRQPTGLDTLDWAERVCELGAGEILLTSKDRDGTLEGYDIPITRAVAEAVGIPVIASGGVGSVEHMYEAFTVGKADACLAASVFHFNQYTIGQVKSYLMEKGIPLKI